MEQASEDCESIKPTVTNALSATFTFLGASGHGGTPLGNKSGLDGALLMATMSEYLREKKVAPSGRFHYAIINGGGAPNVTPDMCSIWFFVREGSPDRARVLYDKIVECGQAAARASQTRMVHKFHAGTWNLLASKAGSELLNDNMRQIGPPRFTDTDHALARGIQKSLGRPETGMPTALTPLTPPAASYTGGLSTDTADVSWQTPTAVLLAAAFPPGLPNHNWGTTSTAATNIGHQAMLSAARYLAAAAVDVIEQPPLLDAMTREFNERKAGVAWKSLIPDGRQPPLYEPTSGVPERDPPDLATGRDHLACPRGRGHRTAGLDRPSPATRGLTAPPVEAAGRLGRRSNNNLHCVTCWSPQQS